MFPNFGLNAIQVKIAALNDSQYIGMCIYNIAVLSLLGVVLAFALTDQVDLSYIFTCCIIIFGTTSTQLIIFIPKVGLKLTIQNKRKSGHVYLLCGGLQWQSASYSTYFSLQN